DDLPWDGTVSSYIPSPQWRSKIADTVRLHSKATEPDPVTYEILRHRLWTINTAHGEILRRISGSPIFALLDFNMSILTEDAEYVMNAPYVQFLNAGASLGIRYILEHLSHQPGIAPGDIFLCNDPWIAAVHQ